MVSTIAMRPTGNNAARPNSPTAKTKVEMRTSIRVTPGRDFKLQIANCKLQIAGVCVLGARRGGSVFFNLQFEI
jgi:hypothetical protein